jgi:triacylglycerol lipase
MLKKTLLLLCLSLTPQLVLAEAECVVLLHGLARISNAMGELEDKLQHAGYKVANVNYPSRRFGVSALAADAVGRGLTHCQAMATDTVHFVTHSLGGILLRVYLHEHEVDELGHVVMLGPPNQGSELLNGLIPIPGVAWFLGPVSKELGTDADSVVPQLGPVHFDLGIIAGNSNIFPLFKLFQAGPSDGIVTVESTKVAGMKQHLVLPVTHTFMMRNNTVIDHAIHYLKTGSFMPRNG